MNEDQANPVDEVYIGEYTDWKHPSGVEVRVIGTGKIKLESPFDGADAGWMDSVTYKNPSGETPDQLFTRSRKSFLSKFKAS